MGLGAGQLLQRDTSAASAAQAAVAPELSDSQLLALFRSIDWNVQEQQGLDKLGAGLAHSELLRAEVLKRYQEETQPTIKYKLSNLLTSEPLPAVAKLATSWAQQTDNAATRADGFQLLANLPPSAETYRLAQQALLNEQDPKALAKAVWALNSPEPILDPAQVQANVPRLHALTQHIDADVRAASIQRLATWDKAKQFIAQDVLRIITTDTNHDTQIAATGATSISSLNSDELKRAFFALLENPSANQELQGVILMQMDRFALSASEYETHQKIVARLMGNQQPSQAGDGQ